MYHALQYQRLQVFVGRNLYSQPEVGARSGVATVINRSAVYYLAVAICLNFTFFMVAGSSLTATGVAVTALWGISFTHYFLDRKIWRTREDKELARALSL